MSNSEERLNRIEDKIDNIVTSLASIDVTLAKQHTQLVYHIKRTDELQKKIIPMDHAIAFMKILAKIIGVLGMLVGIIGFIASLVK